MEITGMNRKQLLKEIKSHIEFYAYKNTSLDIKISDKAVLNIIRIIEDNYHNNLFPKKP